MSLDTSVEVVSAAASCVKLEQGPEPCIVYPIISPFLLSCGGGFHESFANLQLLLIVKSQGLPVGTEREI